MSTISRVRIDNIEFSIIDGVPYVNGKKVSDHGDPTPITGTPNNSFQFIYGMMVGAIAAWLGAIAPVILKGFSF